MYLLTNSVLAVIILLYALINCIICEYIVETNEGKVEGELLEDIKGGEYYSFQSIPYAKPPLKDIRFKAPEPPEPWDGILDGTVDVPKCCQIEMGMITGQEDCLYLNVYSKQINLNDNEELLPVMVYVHPGAYQQGSSHRDMTGPEFLLTEDIVLVTINYRLGLFVYFVTNKMTDIVVTIEQGTLRGKTAEDYKGNTYYSFQGIPYAKPPIGELRFKSPQPAEKWTGVKDASQEGSVCYSVHMIHQTIVGSEDCLYLNVYTPELSSNAHGRLKPVMVWIHGGGFTSGSGNTEFYGPEFLITKDVVIVTINYRLGALGFLSLTDPNLGVPGNAGLKDQVMALKWVQKNIHNFCGDPNNVTIFGESAGGASVHYLLLSPMGKGLFHKAIAQSGCTLNPWALATKSVAFDLAKQLNFEYTEEKQLLNFLQNIPVEKLHQAQLAIKDHFRADIRRLFGPIVESHLSTEETFLAENPLDIILQGKYNKVPLIMGYNSAEGMLIDLYHMGKETIIKDFEEYVPYTLQLPKGSDTSLLAAKKIKEFYYGKEEPKLENKDNLYAILTDNMFLRGIYMSAKYHVQSSIEPVYYYKFSFDGNMNLFKKFASITLPGACHADELGYLFKTFVSDDIDPTSAEAKVLETMVTLWTNFARNGNPNSVSVDSLINVVWEPITKEKINFLDIDKKLTVDVNPENERMLLWDEIYKLNPLASKL